MKVGMVSTYPPPESTHVKQGGVALYTKNLVVSLLNNCSVTVFADRMPNADDEYCEDAKVYRCWNKGVMYPFQILKKLFNENIDLVHVQHEVYLYGGLGSAIVFPLLLFFIRLLRKPVIVTLHGVIPLSKVDRRFLEENWIRGNPFVMKSGLIFLMKIITLFSTSIIVHEERFKDLLIREYHCSSSKICVVHHGIEEGNDLIEKDQAKRILGLGGKNVILFFGYITGYKNVELLMESANFLKTRNWVMVIAGGAHPRLSDDLDYRKYLFDLREKALAISKDRILFRGFIAEEEVPLYFSAADLVVFPYTTAISSSGPICLAVSYKRPFLVSDSFKQVVKIEELIFKADPQELASKIEAFFKNQALRYKALKYTKQLGSERSWSSVAKKTISIYEMNMSISTPI